jgi:hypothetical protein
VLGSYGQTDYFELNARANRTLAVTATALDESGAPSELKARPVIGMWAMADEAGTLAPAATTVFNTGFFGMTKLSASLLGTTSFRIAIADERGDGRPDFAYHARVLYADRVSPTRLGMQSAASVAITGLGFAPGLTAATDVGPAPILALSGEQMVVRITPPGKDGTGSITITDPASGASTMMVDELTFGAGPNDTLALVEGGNPAVPVGGETPNPIVVAVVGPGGEPVPGATVVWSASSGTLSACKDGSTCTVYSDESGMVSTRVTVTSAQNISVAATLAPASYSQPSTVKTTVAGMSTSLDLTLTSQYRWLAQGASAALPLSARLLSNGKAQSGVTIDYQILSGSGLLSAGKTVTDGGGNASVTLNVTNLPGEMQVSACVAPNDAPCQLFYVFAVAPSELRLQAVSGSEQRINAGQQFAPVVMRVTDSAVPPDVVQAAPVTLQEVVMHLAGGSTDGGGDFPGTVILSSNQTTAASDVDGLVSITPSTAGFTGMLEVLITAIAGPGATQSYDLSTWWPAPASPDADVTSPSQQNSGVRGLRDSTE